jgi:hypothetical protein
MILITSNSETTKIGYTMTALVLTVSGINLIRVFFQMGFKIYKVTRRIHLFTISKQKASKYVVETVVTNNVAMEKVKEEMKM